ncbi:MAG: DUF4235 domain-containing protein [Nocardioidaceae bacterium]
MARRSGSSAGKKKEPGKGVWKMYGRTSALLAGVASRRMINLGWQVALGRQPPASPENPEVTTLEAVTWAVLSGATSQLAKVYVTRRAVSYWVRSFDTLPPGIKASQLTSGTTKKR